MIKDDVNYVQDLLKKKESATLDFKANLDKDEVAQVICSFLNRDGGQLVIGVDGNQNVVGIEGEVPTDDLQHYLMENIIPEPAVSVNQENIGKKKILIVAVWRGTQQPYIFKGAVYYRTGSKTVQANSNQLASLIHKEAGQNQRWEAKSAIEVELDDIDLNEVQACMKEAIMTGREKNLPEDPLQFLSKFNLYKNGDFTNAAVILFGKNPVQLFPQVRIRLSVFNTDKTGGSILYDRIFEKNLFQSLNQIIEFFDLAYGISSSFNSSEWRRKDKMSFPRLAVREAILNAFIHRDYSSFSSSIAINIYPEKLEITSYGSLPEGITVSSLSKDHLSIPVNPNIAHIFFIRSWIEKIGIGTVKMINQCKELGFKPPKWKVQDNSVKVTFPGLVVPFNYNGGVNEGVNEGINEGINELINNSQIEGISEGISEGVKRSFNDIIALIVKEKSIRASEIADQLNKPYKTIERHISSLKNLKVIEFLGSNKTGGYELTREFKDILKKHIY